MGDHSLLTSGTNTRLNCGLQVSVLKKTFKVSPAERNAAAFMCLETLLLNISWGKKGFNTSYAYLQRKKIDRKKLFCFTW